MLLLLEMGLLESALAAPTPLEDCSIQALVHTMMTLCSHSAIDSVLSRGLSASLGNLNRVTILRSKVIITLSCRVSTGAL